MISNFFYNNHFILLHLFFLESEMKWPEKCENVTEMHYVLYILPEIMFIIYFSYINYKFSSVNFPFTIGGPFQNSKLDEILKNLKLSNFYKFYFSFFLQEKKTLYNNETNSVILNDYFNHAFYWFFSNFLIEYSYI